MTEDLKKVENLEDAQVDGISPSGAPTNLDPNNINEDLEDLGLPELPPEVIEEVQSAYEAVQSLEDLWKNLIYQHRVKFEHYQQMQEGLSSMSFDRPETRVNFTELNELRDELVKIEGGLETLNMYRKYVLKEDEKPWLEVDMEKQRSKIKVATSSQFTDKNKKKDYSGLTDWQGGQDPELNKLK